MNVKMSITQSVPAALTGIRELGGGLVGISAGRWWRVGVLPSVALARGVRLAARVDRQLLQLLVSGPLADCLLPLLDPLQVALTLLVPVLPTLAWRAGARHLGGL